MASIGIAQQLVDFVLSGHSVVVKRSSGMNREIVIRNSYGGETARIEASSDDYELAMEDVVKSLAAAHGTRIDIAVGMTHFGQQWVEVRSGLFGRRVAKLGISPRHIAKLCDLIAA
jgi:hypothetical protein